MVRAEPPTITVSGRVLAPERIILPVEIMVGRENPTAQPDANSMSFSWVGPLPPEFVRGAPVNGTLLGYALPGWDDVWTDLWSTEPSMPGLIPEPTPEGFAQWGMIDTDTTVATWYEDGGATLVTQFPAQEVSA